MSTYRNHWWLKEFDDGSVALLLCYVKRGFFLLEQSISHALA